MPSARTHDTITVILTLPTFLAVYAATRNLTTATAAAAAFLFGGLMFGPDLDTISRQYSRWAFLKVIWLPYRSFFKHRSRFTHGLIFGALLRVLYFCGAVTLVLFGAFYGYATYTGGRLPGLEDIAAVWRPVGDLVNRDLGGVRFYGAAFLGLWLGAASHTFTDVAGSYLKTGKVAKFL